MAPIKKNLNSQLTSFLSGRSFDNKMYRMFKILYLAEKLTVVS